MSFKVTTAWKSGQSCPYFWSVMDRLECIFRCTPMHQWDLRAHKICSWQKKRSAHALLHSVTALPTSAFIPLQLLLSLVTDWTIFPSAAKTTPPGAINKFENDLSGGTERTDCLLIYLIAVIQVCKTQIIEKVINSARKFQIQVYASCSL